MHAISKDRRKQFLQEILLDHPLFSCTDLPSFRAIFPEPVHAVDTAKACLESLLHNLSREFTANHRHLEHEDTYLQSYL